MDASGAIVDFNTPITGDVTLTARVVKNTEAVRVQYKENAGSTAADLQFPDGFGTDATYGTYWYVEEGTALNAQRVPQDIAGDSKLVTAWDAQGETVDDLTKVVNVTDPGDGFTVKPTAVDAKAKTLTVAFTSYGYPAGGLSDGYTVDGIDVAYAKDTTGDSLTVPAFVVTSGDVTVKNWVDKANQNNGVTYAAGDSVDLSKGNVTLIAHDTTTKHVVTFDSNGGSAVASQTVDDKGYVTLPEAPTREGYVFKGWTTTGDSTTYDDQIDFNAKPITADTTFTAQWAKTSSVKVTFKDATYNGNNKTVDVVVDANTYLTADQIPDFTREGYLFAGWERQEGTKDVLSENELTNKLVADLNNGSNVTYVAKWQKATIDIAAAALKYITVNNDRFTDASWNAYATVLEQAQKDYDKAQYDSPEVSAAAAAKIVTNLNAAWQKLVFKSDADHTTPAYRFYNHVTNEHLFTTNLVEVAILKDNPDWNYENVAFNILNEEKANEQYATLADFKTAVSKVTTTGSVDAANLEAQLEAVAQPVTVEVSRLYNRVTNEHLFTTNPAEVDTLVAGDWGYESSFYAPVFSSNKSVYRLYNPILNQHLFTQNQAEVDKTTTEDWVLEGIAFKAL